MSNKNDRLALALGDKKINPHLFHLALFSFPALLHVVEEVVLVGGALAPRVEELCLDPGERLGEVALAGLKLALHVVLEVTPLPVSLWRVLRILIKVLPFWMTF